MKSPNSFALLLLVPGLLVAAGQRNGSLKLGYVNCLTGQMPKEKGQSVHTAPGILVRFANKAGTRESFGLSNQIGVVVVPLRPGEYCYEAYNHNGQPLNLDPEQDRCFEVKEGKYITIGVGLTADQPVPILEK